MKKAISLLLILVLALALVPAVSAASDEASDAAWALFGLGLFKGSGTLPGGAPDVALDRAPSRSEAVAMLVRLLGKEAEALAGSWTTPFTDLADWAKPYVGYAYVNGLTFGVSWNTFGAARPVGAAEYLTFVLRALGYSSDGDFEWDRAWELSDRLGVTDGRYNENTKAFTRGDLAIVSNRALDVPCKGGETTLLAALGKTRRVFDPQDLSLEDLRGVWIKEGAPKDGETCIAFYDDIMVGAYSVGDAGRDDVGLSVFKVTLSGGEITRLLLRRRTAALDEENGYADTRAVDFDAGEWYVMDVLRIRMPDANTLCYSIGSKNPRDASKWVWTEELSFTRAQGAGLFDRVDALLRQAPERAKAILQGAWYLKTEGTDPEDDAVRIIREYEALVSGDRAELALRRTAVDAKTGAVRSERLSYAVGTLSAADDALVFSGTETSYTGDCDPDVRSFDDRIFDLEFLTQHEAAVHSASPTHGLLADVRAAIA